MIIEASNRVQQVKAYYFATKMAQLAEMRQEGKDVINLGIGSPDLAPDDSVIDALVQSANNKNNHAYQSYAGLPELRDAMAIWYYKTYKVKLDRNKEVLPLIGSKEGIMHISLAFLNPGDGVLVPNPGYPTYASVSKLVEADLITYDLDANNNWLPNLDELRKRDLSKVKLMWVNYPNMPTGAPGDHTFFKELIAFAKENQILIVNDNPYSLVLQSNPSSIFQVEGAKELCIELNSLSKSHNLAGWRVGMLMGESEYIQAVLKVKSNVDTGMFKGLQEAAVEALMLEDDWTKQLDEIYEKRRKLVWQIMDKLNCTYNESYGGMFVWGKLLEGVNSDDFIEKILEQTFVFITPGFIFGSNGEGFIRISLCADEKVYEEVLERLNKLQ